MMDIINALLLGEPAPLQDVTLVRTALLKGWNVYEPLILMQMQAAAAQMQAGGQVPKQLADMQAQMQQMSGAGGLDVSDVAKETYDC